MSEHSPGPWRVANETWSTVIADGEDGGIATMLEPSDTMEADARLIAAAPDLLDMVKDLLGWDNCECGHPACKRGAIATAARDLIRRIEGEP